MTTDMAVASLEQRIERFEAIFDRCEKDWIGMVLAIARCSKALAEKDEEIRRLKALIEKA